MIPTPDESGVRLKAASAPHYEVRAWPSMRVLSAHHELLSVEPLCRAARVHNARVVAVRVADGVRLATADKPGKGRSLSIAYGEVLAEQERETNAALGRGQWGERAEADSEDEEHEEEAGAA